MIILSHKEDCCGCTACLSVCPKQCIRMEKDEEGFLYPKIDTESCIDCEQCEKVCPCLNSTTPREPMESYASIHQEETIRQNSSSGGIFTALAEATIRNGGVVFGARFDNGFQVIHDYTEILEGLTAFRGSKYVQSELGECFRQTEAFLKEGREVLFSGVPCQIAGLRAFLRKEYPHLITVDILCHGVASPAVWADFLKPYRGIRLPDTLKQITFRDKRNGWKQYGLCLHYTKGELFFKQKDNLYMKGNFANLYLRPSCHACPDRCFRAGSDVTLGDCWGIEKQSDASFCTDNKGVSLVLVHTTKGAERIQQIKPYTSYAPIDYHELEPYNPAIRSCAERTHKRERFFVRWQQQEPLGKIVASLTRPSLIKQLELLCTPLLKALGIKGFTKRLRK